jgi:hypothetical protein
VRESSKPNRTLVSIWRSRRELATRPGVVAFGGETHVWQQILPARSARFFDDARSNVSTGNRVAIEGGQDYASTLEMGRAAHARSKAQASPAWAAQGTSLYPSTRRNSSNNGCRSSIGLTPERPGRLPLVVSRLTWDSESRLRVDPRRPESVSKSGKRPADWLHVVPAPCICSLSPPCTRHHLVD